LELVPAVPFGESRVLANAGWVSAAKRKANPMKQARKILLVPLLGLLLLLGLVPLVHASETFPEATPESVGLDAERIDELALLVFDFVEAGQVVGAEILIVKDRRTVLHEVAGLMDLEEETPLVRDTICNIRSMTKPILGTAVQLLIDRERLALDASVAVYLEAFDNESSRAITLEHLLTHRSGLPWEAPEKPWEEYPSLKATVEYWGGHGPDFEPGTKFAYSDPGSDTLAVLVAERSGRPFHEFIVAEVFAPLGMTSSFPMTGTDDPRMQRVSSNHIFAEGKWQRYWQPSEGPMLPFVKGSGTTWYSTPMDYARFVAFWLDGGTIDGERLLSEEAVRRALAPAVETPLRTALPDTRVDYGHHWEVFVDTQSEEPVAFGHNGSDGTYVWAWPELDLIVCYFTQSRGGRTGRPFEKALGKLVESAAVAAR
jgi:CubicO group peptidase (beta-lactamase class C family)